MTIWAAAAVAAGLTGCVSLEPPVAPPSEVTNRGTEPTSEQSERIEAAKAAREAGEYDTALSIFGEILAENPTVTVAYLGIGDIHMDLREYAKAEPAYARAARLEPRNFDAQYGHGLALQMLERFVEAVRAYHRALTIQPEHVEANLNLATTYLEMKDPNRAVVFAEKAVESGLDNGPARANLGAIYEQLGRDAEAIDAYIAAIELMGNQPPLLMNLINALSRESRYREAANTAEVLTRIEPTAAAYERLGWCLFKLREYDDSLAAYREAVDIDPEHWPALNGIGVNSLNSWLLSKQRDEQAKASAGDAFRRSVRINPDQPKVVQLLLKYSL
jgi:superkiller protein 3